MIVDVLFINQILKKHGYDIEKKQKTIYCTDHADFEDNQIPLLEFLEVNYRDVLTLIYSDDFEAVVLSFLNKFGG